MTHQVVHYTIPEPGTINEGHDDFVDALADLRIDWTGDDYGLFVATGLGNLAIPPGTRVTVRIEDPMLPDSLTVMMPDGSSVIFAAAPRLPDPES